MTVLEYLLEAERVFMDGVWWVDGKINILRIFRLVWSLAAMKGIRMRKQQFLGDKERACRNLDVRSNSNRLPRN